jgi:serine protease Do
MLLGRVSMSRIFTFFCLIIISCASVADNSVQKLFKKVNNSVVELHVKSIAKPKPNQVTFKESIANSLGSGAVISASGRILTAAHVVDRATSIEVIYADGSKTSGHLVWINSLLDLAMIQATKVPDSVVPLKLAKAGNYDIGEQVIAIGAPYGVSHSLSVGYLSGIRDREKIPGTAIVPRFLQTDAAINQGNSGGPMFNSKGEIIGIVSHILSKAGGSNGLGFALSVDSIHALIKTKPATFAGFIPHLLSEVESKALNNPYGYGMLIQQVIPGTLADKLGFKGGYLNIMMGNKPILLGGDILLEISGRPLTDVASVIKLQQRFSSYAKGDKITFKFLRNGAEKQVRWVVE